MNTSAREKVIVVGAGIGGLSAALDLAAAGVDVTVLELAPGPGGKLRQFPSDAGPVDAGPTVLTLRPVFDALFERAGSRLSEHVTLRRETVLARHWWQDGSSLDLFADPQRSADAVGSFAGSRGRDEFVALSGDARRLFEAFDMPVMRSERPDLVALGKTVLSDPVRLLRAMAPLRSLASSLESRFGDPRLRQLFGRYATYVGGSPFLSPAILSLIWDAEARGVWRIEGGMIGLARALDSAARGLGARFRYGTAVEELIARNGRVGGVRLATGEVIESARVVFNGDPAALTSGLLGVGAKAAVRSKGVAPRSLSAWVWAFAARPSGRELSHHNVFFGARQSNEFDALARGAMPDDPTLYVCAQDRGDGTGKPDRERFEIIMNGAPVGSAPAEQPEDFSRCRTRTFQTLRRMGLDFDTIPGRAALITPGDFANRFPGSAGSLYGRSPHGMMATFHRPEARSRVAGLYLAGGGVHPGAGLPMASLSGQHAAAAILKDLASTSASRRTAMPGGMSTVSRMTEPAQSRSSRS